MDDDVLSHLARQFEPGYKEPEENDVKHHGLKFSLDWEPRLNPTQRLVYESRARFILAYGERGTGKSIGLLHKLVHHCVFNKNARALIIVKEVGQASEGGAWSKLQTDILPQWKRGNYDRKTKKTIDSGFGIDYTSEKQDPKDKKSYIWITNIHGGWSMVKLISLFVGEQVEDKVKGKEPSFLFVDEAQTTESDDYFSKLTQQLGRVHIEGNQQAVYACNPKGPSHWLYRRFFCHGLDEEGTPAEFPIDEETGHPVDPETKNPIKDYAIFHVPIHENKHNLPDGYWDIVLNACKNDPVEYARMVEGRWVDKPEGAALFKDEWNDQRHLRGEILKSTGVLPVPGHLMVLGWDPGSAHTSIHFMQFVPTVKNIAWLVFDEFNLVGRYMTYRELVPKLINRMRYWEERVSNHFGYPITFAYRHISDDSAFNQVRAKDGSFDAQDIEMLSREHVAKNQLPERFVIKMRACPKGPHSVEARVRIAKDLLIENRVVVSGICHETRQMFMGLEADKDNQMKPKRSRFIHPFDSVTYPPLYYNSGAGRSAAAVIKEATKTEFYRML